MMNTRVEMSEDMMMQVNGGAKSHDPLNYLNPRNKKLLEEKREEEFRKEHNYKAYETENGGYWAEMEF